LPISHAFRIISIDQGILEMWRSLTSQEIFLLPRNLKVHYCVHVRTLIGAVLKSAESSPHHNLISSVVDPSLLDFRLICCRHFTEFSVLHDLPILLIWSL
jgi:hypothetical protein